MAIGLPNQARGCRIRPVSRTSFLLFNQGTSAMNTDTESLARFSEALAPLGMSDSSKSPALGERERRSPVSRLNDFAWAAARLITATSLTVALYIVALKYVFVLN
jgi:hypothetical protein